MGDNMTGNSPKKQIDKFREAARELETDQSEEAFDAILKKVAKAPPPKEDINRENDMPSVTAYALAAFNMSIAAIALQVDSKAITRAQAVEQLRFVRDHAGLPSGADGDGARELISSLIRSYRKSDPSIPSDPKDD